MIITIIFTPDGKEHAFTNANLDEIRDYLVENYPEWIIRILVSTEKVLADKYINCWIPLQNIYHIEGLVFFKDIL